MDVVALLEELQAIARDGLTYAQNVYNRERYERLLELSAQRYATLLDLPSGAVKAKFRQELGYITPKLGGQLRRPGRASFNPRTDTEPPPYLTLTFLKRAQQIR